MGASKLAIPTFELALVISYFNNCLKLNLIKIPFLLNCNSQKIWDSEIRILSVIDLQVAF